VTTIDSFDARLVRVPLTRPWASDVTSIGVIATHVTRSDGAEGWGFSWTPQIGAEAVHALIRHDIAPAAIGRDADAETVWQPLWQRLHEAGGGGITSPAYDPEAWLRARSRLAVRPRGRVSILLGQQPRPAVGEREGISGLLLPDGAPQPVDRPAPGRQREPGPGVRWDPVDPPGLQGGDHRLLHRLLGDVEVPDPAVQRGHDQTDLVPDDLRERRVRDAVVAHRWSAQSGMWL